MIKLKYLVENYRDDPRAFDEHFMIIGRIIISDKTYFIVHDTINKENYIKEYYSVNRSSDMIRHGDILASIEDDKEWDVVYQIAKKNNILE